MAAQLLRPCRHSGCGALVSSGYCDAHRHHDCKTVYDQTRRKVTPALAQAAITRSSAQWQNVRTLHRQQYPICCDPFGDHHGMPVPAEHSHHIHPLATHPHLAFDMGNLAPLCVACHAKVERIERNGDNTAPLFERRDEPPGEG